MTEAKCPLPPTIDAKSAALRAQRLAAEATAPKRPVPPKPIKPLRKISDPSVRSTTWWR